LSSEKIESVSKARNKHEMWHDVLQALETKDRVLSRISNKIYTRTDVAKSHLEALVEKGFVTRHGSSYAITGSGRLLLKNLRGLFALIEEASR